MERPEDHSVRRNHLVWATGAKDWRSQGSARGGTCECLQSHSDHCSLPPRDRQQRKPDRFWRWPCEQEKITGPGKQATEFALDNFGKANNPITNKATCGQQAALRVCGGGIEFRTMPSCGASRICPLLWRCLRRH